MNKALILAEYSNGIISPSTLHTVSAAKQITDDVDLLVINQNPQTASLINGIKKVIHIDHIELSNMLAEAVAPVIVDISKDYTHILAAATSIGKDIMPRVAALLDVAQVSEIISVLSPNEFLRPIYAGNAIETVKTLDNKVIITVRHSAFAKTDFGTNPVSIESVSYNHSNTLSEFISSETIASTRPELTSAQRIVSGGRGVGSKENFAIIEALADKLNAAVGASRAAVDAGYISNDAQVGQTGKIVAPELYIAIGISGAIQHIAGMKESKVIVAINKDDSAPIFEVADYGLVGDLFTIIPELISLL